MSVPWAAPNKKLIKILISVMVLGVQVESESVISLRLGFVSLSMCIIDCLEHSIILSYNYLNMQAPERNRVTAIRSVRISDIRISVHE